MQSFFLLLVTTSLVHATHVNIQVPSKMADWPSRSDFQSLPYHDIVSKVNYHVSKFHKKFSAFKTLKTRAQPSYVKELYYIELLARRGMLEAQAPTAKAGTKSTQPPSVALLQENERSSAKTFLRQREQHSIIMNNAKANQFLKVQKGSGDRASRTRSVPCGRFAAEFSCEGLEMSYEGTYLILLFFSYSFVFFCLLYSWSHVSHYPHFSLSPHVSRPSPLPPILILPLTGTNWVSSAAVSTVSTGTAAVSTVADGTAELAGDAYDSGTELADDFVDVIPDDIVDAAESGYDAAAEGVQAAQALAVAGLDAAAAALCPEGKVVEDEIEATQTELVELRARKYLVSQLLDTLKIDHEQAKEACACNPGSTECQHAEQIMHDVTLAEYEANDIKTTSDDKKAFVEEKNTELINIRDGSTVCDVVTSLVDFLTTIITDLGAFLQMLVDIVAAAACTLIDLGMEIAGASLDTSIAASFPALATIQNLPFCRIMGKFN